VHSKVRYLVLPERKIVEASHGQTILDSLLKANIPIDHACGGFGTCGTCRVQVVKGIERVPLRNEIEAEMAQDRGFAAKERLACQSEVCEGLEIERQSPRPSLKAE
jgi:2Fe-2S ferredoxin